MFLVTFVGTMNVLMVMVLTNVELTYDRISNIGLFGWMNLESDRLPVEIAMVLLCNVIGLVGYVRAMQYLAIATAALMQPVAAELMACVLCVGVLHGLWGWIGNALVFAGTLAVVIPTATEEKPEEKTEAS